MKKIFIALLVFLAGLTDPASAQLVYKDVAGIFYSRCTNCHRPNGGAPFSMLTYSETAPWASLIQNAVQTGKMPPWLPDTTYTRFLHERIITAAEKNAILSWVGSGAQAGDTTQAPPPPIYTSQYKLKGTPDLIIKIPAFPSNGNSTDAYNCFSIPTGLTQDRWVRAFEIVPNNPALVHHVVVKVDSTGTVASNTSGNCFSQPGDFDLDVWAVGGQPTVFPGQTPLKTGIRLKAGSNINLQVHYPPGTAGQIDSTQMRIYLYPAGATGIRPIYVSTPLQNWNMFILANTTPTYSAQYPSSGGLPAALSIFGTFPHSHLLCKTMENYADQGATKIPLIKINNWDFEWQGFYTFPNLVKIPAGYTLRSAHMYDNTANNPNNPNSPPQLVTAGEGTTDEMLFDSFQWLYYLPGDENIDIGGLLASDTLWNNPVTSVSETGHFYATASFVYPNPFNTTASVFAPGFDFSAQKPVLKIFDIFGSEVHSQVLGS
ncbi:MAG: hypothetical protein AB1458_16985, partial [Bacteroidota bacterium]